MNGDDSPSCLDRHMNTAAEGASGGESSPIMYGNLDEYKELLKFK